MRPSRRAPIRLDRSRAAHAIARACPCPAPLGPAPRCRRPLTGRAIVIDTLEIDGIRIRVWGYTETLSYVKALINFRLISHASTTEQEPADDFKASADDR